MDPLIETWAFSKGLVFQKTPPVLVPTCRVWAEHTRNEIIVVEHVLSLRLELELNARAWRDAVSNVDANMLAELTASERFEVRINFSRLPNVLSHCLGVGVSTPLVSQ